MSEGAFHVIPLGTAPPTSLYEYGASPLVAVPKLPHLVQPLPMTHLVAHGSVVKIDGYTVTEARPVASAPAESDTLTVTPNVPGALGFPLTAPAGVSVSPGGNAATSDQRYGGVPPLAPRETGEQA